MSGNSPFFSIVIPTTRPHYLQYSLASVLAQTFEDFEVIVAFNRVPGGNVLGVLPPDPRLKIVEAEKFLVMYDNWESGFRHSTGQWRMLLGDDDCLVPSALATIAAALKRIPDAETVLWRWGGFIAPDWPAADIAGRARIPPYSMRIDVRSTVEVARLMYGFEAARLSEMTTWLPSVMRGAVRADVIERAWARTGMFCQPLSPDYGAAAQIVALTHEIYLLDMPLVILNHPSDSMVASMQGSTNVKASHFYDLVNDPVFRHTLVQTRYESNRPAICETMMRVREKYPEALGQIQFQLINFLEWYFTGLLESQSSGTVIDESLNELEAVITTLPSVEREELRSRMTLRRASVASASRRQLPNVRGKLMLALMQIAPKLPLGEKILGRIMPRFGLDVLAAEANLKTIKEFAFFVGRVMDESRRAGALA